MKLNIKIKNLGKLSDADVQIRNFTVFAGPNNTGKTYVSKTLYSMLNAIRAEHIGEVSKRNISRAKRFLRRFVDELPDTVEGKEEFAEQIEGLLRKLRRFFIFDHEEQFEERLEKIASSQGERRKIWSEIIFLSGEFNKCLPPEEDSSSLLSAYRKLWLHWSKHLSEENANQDVGHFIYGELAENFARNLRRNFPINDEAHLRHGEQKAATISCEKLGEFRIDRTGAKAECSLENIERFQIFQRLIYLESPVYWKIKDTLEARRFRRGWAPSIPQYFYDLMAELRETKDESHQLFHDYYKSRRNISDMAVQETLVPNENPKQMDLFHELHEDITKTIGGKLIISEENDLLLQENGRVFPLSVAAMGVVNYGMLSLLIEKGIIDENTFLFMDEPEAHLHPAWQVKMAATLYKLAQLGVHVIISTHSVDILKWIEVEVNNNPDSEHIIALNHFSAEGKTLNHGDDFLKKLASIKEELNKPYYHLYLQEK